MLRLSLRAFQRFVLLLTLSCALRASSLAQTDTSYAQAVRSAKHPRLVVVLSIDQFRGDYLLRFADLFAPAKKGRAVGGFSYLMQAGSYFTDAKHSHLPTFTGPGHAVQLTGAPPSISGIISNEWWDPLTSKVIYCVADPLQKVVGAVASSKATPMGPLNLRSTTIGDELKLASNGLSKVVSVAMKDRAAILMGGHLQDVCLWFDEYSGGWISSTAYCKSGKLPNWVEALNARQIPASYLGKAWNPNLPEKALQRALPSHLPLDANPKNYGRVFPHTLGTKADKEGFNAFAATPFANEYVFQTAMEAVRAEQLGQREGVSDVLNINLSTNDYIGHVFGPYSAEVMDCTVQTDRQLSLFLNYLNKTVPGGLKEILVVVTADHGVAPVAEHLTGRAMEAGKIGEKEVERIADEALGRAFGETDWIGGESAKGSYQEPYLYLNPINIQRVLANGKAKSRAEIEEIAANAVAKMESVYTCFTRTQIMNGLLPKTEIAQRAYNGFHPKRSGDVMVVIEQNYLHYLTAGTSHGSAFAYDTHVPLLLAGFGIRSGVWGQPVSVLDIAPTLATLLGLEFPSGCQGSILTPALR